MVLLSIFLTLHLIALVIMAGTTLIDYLSFQTFWKLFETEKEKSAGLLLAMGKFSRLAGIGAALLILTGIGMMAVTRGVFGDQLWFRIKFVLVLILIANGVFVGRRQGLKLRKLIDANSPLAQAKRNIKRFHLIQLSLFFLIIILSVFKFN